MSAPFRDRRDAGRRLAARLREVPLERPVVAGIPRGGIVVAAEVAEALQAPLDAIVVRKIVADGDLALGAVAEGGVRAESEPLVRAAGLSRAGMGRLVAAEATALAERVAFYRSVRPQVPFRERTVVIVDDGLTTGPTAEAAARSAFARGATRLVLAVPVSSRETLDAVRPEFDEVVCLETPPLLLSLDEWYLDNRDVGADEAAYLLGAVTRSPARSS